MRILTGDCLQEILTIPNESVDLVFTSPPYAEQRKKTYGGIPADQYVDWFLMRAEHFGRVLKPTGSLVVNIKEHVSQGERSTYVLELILALRKSGWMWVEEYIWCKSTSVPGKWPNRFRDSWERCLHFTRQKSFFMDQDSVRVPVGDWANGRLQNLSDKDQTRQDSATGSGFARQVSAWQGRDTVYPTNVLHSAGECRNVGHPAAFPTNLPNFFIKLFSPPNGVVLDPFMGSGTTGEACLSLGRDFIGIEINDQYVRLARKRLNLDSPFIVE